MNAKKGAKWYMAGTDKTGKYLVVVQGSLGRVGYRELGGEKFRIRVEPTEMAASTVLAPFFTGWKQPDNQLRFSCVMYGSGLKTAVGQAIKALATVNHLQANSKAPEWAKELVAKAVTEAEAAAKAIEAAKKAEAKKVAKPKTPIKKTAPKAKPAKKAVKKAA